MRLKVMLVLTLGGIMALAAVTAVQAQHSITLHQKPVVFVNPQGPTAPFQYFQGQQIQLQAGNNIRYQW
jgi:hypothetical protein